MKKILAASCVILAGCGGSGSNSSSSFGPANTTPVALQRQVLSDALVQPMLYLVNSADSRYAYVLERFGTMRVLVDDALQDSPVLDLTSTISSAGDGGMLGLALAPDFATSHVFYVYSTFPSPLRGRVTRFVMNDDMVSANPVGQTIIEFEFPYNDHKGGSLHFGKDGMLYLGIGDGGSENDPENRSQNPLSLLGKMLRIDPSGDDFPSDSSQNYRIPPSNPFVNKAGVRPEIWALGLRNPFRWSIDSQTGALVIGDVGQLLAEEVDFIPNGKGGRNFGWRVEEGFGPNGNAGPTYSTPLRKPMLAYGRDAGVCITGGYVVRKPFLDLGGSYLFADFGSNHFWSVPLWVRGNGEVETTSLTNARELTIEGGWKGIVSIDPDANGAPVVCELFQGSVSRLSAAPPETP